MRVWDGKRFVVEKGREPGGQTRYLADYLTLALIVLGVVALGAFAAAGR